MPEKESRPAGRRPAQRLCAALLCCLLPGLAPASSSSGPQWPGAAPASEPPAAAEGISAALAECAGLPPYLRRAAVSGLLGSTGSDTMNNLMTLWAEAFQRLHPGMDIQVEGKGSSTGPAALLSGTAQLAPMSRPMKAEEVSRLRKRHGRAPLGIPVALDALAVFVHRAHPLDSLDLDRLGAAFAAGAGPLPVETWGDLGVTGPLARRFIRLYGRNSASGTSGFFRERVLGNRYFKDRVQEQMGSGALIAALARDPLGLGYCGIGYRTSGVKTLALKRDPASPALLPGHAALRSGLYPLSRNLFIYVLKPRGGSLDPRTEEFLRFILSRDGQEIAAREGYLPLTPAALEAALAALAPAGAPEGRPDGAEPGSGP